MHLAICRPTTYMDGIGSGQTLTRRDLTMTRPDQVMSNPDLTRPGLIVREYQGTEVQSTSAIRYQSIIPLFLYVEVHLHIVSGQDRSSRVGSGQPWPDPRPDLGQKILTCLDPRRVRSGQVKV